MERALLIITMLCLLAAALFLWRSKVDEVYLNAAFIAGSLGLVAWLLRLKTQLRKTLPRTASVAAEETEEEDEE